MIGDGMRVRHGFRALTATALTGTMLAVRHRDDVGRRGRRGIVGEHGTGSDLELHHRRDDLDPDGDAGGELLAR